MMPRLSALKNFAVVGFQSHQSLLINGHFLIQIFCIQSILLFPRYNLNLWRALTLQRIKISPLPSWLMCRFLLIPFSFTPSFLPSFHHFRYPRNSFARFSGRTARPHRSQSMQRMSGNLFNTCRLPRIFCEGEEKIAIPLVCGLGYQSRVVSCAR